MKTVLPTRVRCRIFSMAGVSFFVTFHTFEGGRIQISQVAQNVEIANSNGVYISYVIVIIFTE